MRVAVLALLVLTACEEDEDFGLVVSGQLGGDYVGIAGNKSFDQAEIEAGITPSSSILATAETFCGGSGVRLISATSAISDPSKVTYFFRCH